MKDSYNKLRKNLKDFDDKTADARTRVTEMQTTGTAYFAGRAAAVKKIQDPALQTQAQQRLDASQKGFAGVIASLGRDARGTRSATEGACRSRQVSRERSLAERHRLPQVAGRDG